MTRSVAGEQWLSVSEAGRALGLSRTSMITAEEAGLLTPKRTPGGHRRYHPAELRRYLDAAGPGPMPPARSIEDGAADAPAAPPPGPDPTGSGPALDPAPLGMAAVARAAVQPLVRQLDARSGGLYLVRDATLRFCAASGVPRWLTERLATEPPPHELAQALDVGRARLFDPAAIAFPEPRSTGHGVVVAVPGPQRPLGLLFVVLPPNHAPLPAELRTVDAFAELIGLVVAVRRQVGDLECRLARIAALSAA